MWSEWCSTCRNFYFPNAKVISSGYPHQSWLLNHSSSKSRAAFKWDLLTGFSLCSTTHPSPIFMIIYLSMLLGPGPSIRFKRNVSTKRYCSHCSSIQSFSTLATLRSFFLSSTPFRLQNLELAATAVFLTPFSAILTTRSIFFVPSIRIANWSISICKHDAPGPQ